MVLVGESTQRATAELDRLRAGGRAAAEGQGRARHGVSRASGSSPSAAGAGRGDRLEAAVRRARHRAAPPEGPVPRDGAREARPARLGHRARRGIGKSRLAWELRKYADGVAEDICWHEGRSPAYGAGHHVLGARRDGPGAGAAHRDRRPGDDAGQDRRVGRALRPRAARAGARRARARRPARRRATRRAAAPGAVRRVAPVLRADGRARTWSSGLRGPPLGGLRACSTSSTTCSSGAATSRS